MCIRDRYAAEDILSNQGEVLVEKDTLLEKKATDAKGTLTFDSDLPHGKYYVKEEVRKAGYLPNEEVWNVDATYENQNLAKIELNKEVENQPTETRISKTDATTGSELEGAKLQVIDKDGNIVEEWTSTKAVSYTHLGYPGSDDGFPISDGQYVKGVRPMIVRYIHCWIC